jgi:hypothetical protein
MLNFILSNQKYNFMKKCDLITSVLRSSLFLSSITLGFSVGIAMNAGGVLAEHVTNKWDVRRNLEADNWTVIYSEEFGTDDWAALTLALVADASGCAGGCTSAFIKNFGYQSYNTILQQLGQKSPDFVDSFVLAMTKTDFGSLLASALKNGRIESRNLPGVRLELGSSAYNRKECEFGICVPLPNSHQPWVRVKFLAGTTVAQPLVVNDLCWYQHSGWQNGSATWASGTGTRVGSGWNFKTVFASSNGVIYGINTNNELLWYKHDGWQNGSATWASGTGTKVGSGWDFVTVFASNNGVIYGVKSNGDLYWYRHDGWQDGSNRWSNGGTGIKVGSGWNFRSVFATSDGTIYGIIR